ncbi:MAG: hypothetical protein RL681_72, partial [Candidatus Parcubacteria bacterium]
MNQIQLHKRIDELIETGCAVVDRNVIQEIISTNPDTHRYFFTQANERWLEWLWNNGFLDVIKEKSIDPTQYGYRTPELDYLVKVAVKEPKKVADIILAIPISADHFNPEVVDRFLWICSNLPAEQLSRMVIKIRDGRWIPLMGVFNRWGFEYEKMFATLSSAKDYDGILVLAEAVLAVQTKDELKKVSRGYSTDNPFYFNDISETKVFGQLVGVDESHKERALAIAIRALCGVTITGEREDAADVFTIAETFHLYDVDFFELTLGEKEHLSHRDDVRSLAAVVKTLVVQLIGGKCDDAKNARQLFDKYLAKLPDSRSMWRLRMFTMSLCPVLFRDELKQEFFKIFATDRYHEYISGTEYQKALRLSFSALSEKDKRDYVRRVFEYFTKRATDAEDEKWHKTYGLQILSSICDQLTNEEAAECEKSFERKCDPNYEPEPSIGRMRGGTVRPRGPITAEEFGKLPITDLAAKLRNEWTPK